MMRLRFHPEALVELADAVQWHEKERVGYGALVSTRSHGELAKRLSFRVVEPKSQDSPITMMFVSLRFRVFATSS